MARFKHPKQGKQPVTKQLKRKLTTKRRSLSSGDHLNKSSGVGSGDDFRLLPNSSHNQSSLKSTPSSPVRLRFISSHRRSTAISQSKVQNFARKSILNQSREQLHSDHESSSDTETDMQPASHSARKSISNQALPHAARKSIINSNPSSEDSSSDSDPESNSEQPVSITKTKGTAITKTLSDGLASSLKRETTSKPCPEPSGVNNQKTSEITATIKTSKPKKDPVKVLRKSGNHMRPYVAPHATHRRKNGAWALQEIRYYQKQIGLLIPKTNFKRVVKEILSEYKTTNYQIQSAALLALQEAAETHLTQTFEAAQLCAVHAKRVTLMKPDFTLVKWFK